ncbi:interleukin-17 receptor E [Catharus ustulatus]|uniref:interleukin-17 receptor E n=1 Tax=Catharus ustulatus TaxID=91951 RepID=UPI00140D979B|nr:interleukin-17 receptor E [Catharus ustulatus]
MGRPVLLAAAAALLLLPPPDTGAAVTRLRVSANFECRAIADRTLSRPRCRRPSRPGPPLEPPALSLSHARLCLPAQPCQPCLRVRLALPTSELGGVRGLQLTFMELGSNRAGWLQVWQRRRVLGSSAWQVQFDCFPAESGRQVLVSLRTIPDRGLALNRSHLVTAEPPGPVFTHAWVPEMRAIEVWVPAGPALMVRLCHQLALECEELPWPFHQQVLVPGGHHISLPYEFLVPCLCIEASYSHHDSPRRKHCPFRDRPDAYGPELWSSVRFHDYSTSSKDQMAMMLNASCPLHPRATLCWRETADEAAPCHDIPNSTASEDERVYILDKVDVHPQLCFRFSYKNSSHVECPHQPETAWNVSVSVWGFQLRLHLTSRIPAAFSAALCQRQGGQCEPEAPLYTVTQPEGSAPGELALLLPVQVLGSCVLVWRSDVHFARKQLLCPDGERGSWRGTQGAVEWEDTPLIAFLPVSRRHFGLLGLLLALGLVVTVLLLNCRGAWRPDDGVPGGRPVLLLYSPDSEEHLGLVCALAERLRAGLGCDVRLDLWEAGGLGQTGALPWLYAQRSRVGRQRGTVLLLWSRGSARLFHRWQVGMADGTPGDAHDIFGAAMACLHGELGAAGRGGGWVLAYFSRLCSPRDVPRPLRPLPTYRLPRQLPGLLGALRGSPPAPRRCYRGRAGGLLHRLLEVGTGEGSPPPRPPKAASGT